jgi:hypothetical protein
MVYLVVLVLVSFNLQTGVMSNLLYQEQWSVKSLLKAIKKQANKKKQSIK